MIGWIVAVFVFYMLIHSELATFIEFATRAAQASSSTGTTTASGGLGGMNTSSVQPGSPLMTIG